MQGNIGNKMFNKFVSKAHYYGITEIFKDIDIDIKDID